MGIVHKNLTPQQQAAEVARVKRYESGVLRDPVVITPQHTVRQVIAMQEQLGISGFPVIDGGTEQGAEDDDAQSGHGASWRGCVKRPV